MLEGNGLNELVAGCGEQRIASLCAPACEEILFSASEPNRAASCHPFDERDRFVFQRAEVLVAGRAKDPFAVATDLDRLFATRLGIPRENDLEVFLL
jgi:hypothetical protein